MNKKTTARRNFIKRSAMGLGSLAVLPVAGTTQNGALGGKTSSDKIKLKIVCVGAHPGDPEFGCGGTMAKYSDAGHTVTLLYLTRGEASDPKISYSEMAALRTNEATRASQTLNATPMFAGQIDGNTISDKSKNEEMAKMIQGLNPDIVFTHWPVDSHPDHQIAGMLTLTAWVRSGRKFHLYFYEVNSGDETMAFAPTDYVDISATHERKKKAMFAHKTQNPIETYETFFKPMEEFRGLEAGVKVAEGFIHLKSNRERASLIGL